MKKASTNQNKIVVWAVDGMEKVFSDTLPSPNASNLINLAGAAGECEVAQIAVHSTREDIYIYKPKISALRSDEAEISSKNVSSRFVELVPVRFQSQGIPKEELVRVAPGYFPDPLCLEDTITVPAGQTRSIWLTFNIPQDAKGGVYKGDVKVMTSAGEDSIKVKVTVWPFSLPKNIPFAMTQWFQPAIIAKYHCVKLYSEDFWQLLDVYAADMEAHRQNVIFTSIVGGDSLIGIIKTKKGHYKFDFSHFNRWVSIFLKHNFQYIEGSHIFGNVRVLDEILGSVVIVEKKSNKNCISPDEEYIRILKRLIKALRDHVKDEGWADRYIQHVFDEPSKKQVQNYLFMVKLIRDVWPEVPLVDAADSDQSFFDAIDIIVPLIDHRNVYYDVDKYKKMGKTIWSYTCNHPRGQYPNRYLDQPLIMTRIIPWLFWRYGISGYLHWAYAHWSPHHKNDRIDYDPYAGKLQKNFQLVNPWIDQVLGATWSCPAGDAWIVYPPRDPLAQDPQILVPYLVENFNHVRDGHPSNKEKEGPSKEKMKIMPGVVDSIRWEQMREGVEDYGLLWLLNKEIEKANKKPECRKVASSAKKKMEKIVKDIAPDWLNYTRKPSEINKARCRIAEEIIRLRGVNSINNC